MGSLLRVFTLGIHSSGFSSWVFTPEDIRLGLKLLDSLPRVFVSGQAFLGVDVQLNGSRPVPEV